VVVVVIGGVRRDETFSPEGEVNIPHLMGDLLPRSLFYRHARNEGVTAHFNAISSILTGNWQRVDDWGKLAPTSPTLFEQFRKGLGVDRGGTWVVASNKALTSLIGASSASGYGPAYGANVVFPKQLMLMAVAEALRQGRTANMADRSKVEAELESAMEGSNYEGLGWNVFDAGAGDDPERNCGIRAQRRPDFWRRTHLLHDARDHAQVRSAGAGCRLVRCGGGALRFICAAYGRHPDRGQACLSVVAGDRGQSRVPGEDHDGVFARIRTRPGRLIDQWILQSSRQLGIHAGHLDDGAGSGRGQAADD
jgi:hypothetical protein